MAVRMNVLVLRPPGNGSTYHSQFDDVIGQLLGRPGLDVTLLERLPGPDDATTERLALESLGGHIACLAWDEPDTVLADLETAGKPMVRRARKNDPQVPSGDLPSPNGNGIVVGRLFYFDMRRSDANRLIFAELQELLKTLQTPMFQIGSLGSVAQPRLKTKPIAKAMPATEKPTSPVQPLATVKTVVKEPETSPVDDLDRLVDELDELDI